MCALPFAGGDDGELLLWHPAENAVRGNLEEGRGPVWRSTCKLVGHFKDVQDLSWSPDSSALVSGSVDRYSCVWDTRKNEGVVSNAGRLVACRNRCQRYLLCMFNFIALPRDKLLQSCSLPACYV